MRRTMRVAAAAGCVGFLLAAAGAFGYARGNVWRNYGEQFQLGYVVGYLDAAKLAKLKDMRVFAIPGFHHKVDYQRWRAMVNEFYAEPGNAKRPVPDAMRAVGRQIQDEIMKAWQEQRMRGGDGTSEERGGSSGARGAGAAEQAGDDDGDDAPLPAAP